MFRSPQVKWNLISSITNLNYGLRNELQNDLLRFSEEIRKLKNLKKPQAPLSPKISPAPPTKTPADKIIAHPLDAFPWLEGLRPEFTSALDRTPERLHPTLISGPFQPIYLITQVKF